MTIEKQNSFGGLMAIDLYVGGAGAGIFFISYIMDLMNKYHNITKIGVIAGIIMVLIGTLILFLDLGNKSGLYRLISNPSSWVARGTCFITGFVVFGSVYSAFSWNLLGWNLMEKTTLIIKLIGGIAAFFSLMTILYTGMLFSTMKRIPLWNTPILPLLFISTSLYSAMAFLLLIGNLFVYTPMEDIRSLVMVQIILISVQIVVLGVFLWANNYSNKYIVESIRLLIKPVFIWVIVLGLIIPLLLLVYYNVFNQASALIVIFATLLLIEGGFCLRFSIIKAGIRLPIQIA